MKTEEKIRNAVVAFEEAENKRNNLTGQLDMATHEEARCREEVARVMHAAGETQVRFFKRTYVIDEQAGRLIYTEFAGKVIE